MDKVQVPVHTPDDSKPLNFDKLCADILIDLKFPAHVWWDLNRNKSKYQFLLDSLLLTVS